MQPAHRDQRPRRRYRRQWGRPGFGITATQRDQEVTHVGLGHGAQIVDAAQGQVLAVATQIAPIGTDGVGGHPAFDGEVVEVALQLTVQRSGLSRGHARRPTTEAVTMCADRRRPLDGPARVHPPAWSADRH